MSIAVQRGQKLSTDPEAEHSDQPGVPSGEVGRGPGADPQSPAEDDADEALVEERQHRVDRLYPRD